MMLTQLVHIALPVPLWRQVRATAAAQGVKPAEVVEAALRAYLAPHGGQAA